MNFATLIAAGICRIRGHDFGRWATKKTTGPVSNLPYAQPTYGERKCKRCGKTEVGAAPKKRRPHNADTKSG